MPHLVLFVAGMGICTIGLRSRRLGDRKGEGGIEDSDCGALPPSFVLAFLLNTLFNWGTHVFIYSFVTS